MLRYFTKKCFKRNLKTIHRNQKGEGEGTLIFIVIVICLLISGVFWFLQLIKNTKNSRAKEAKERELALQREKKKLQLEKHEPKGYLYYYRPGIHGEEPYKITRPDFGNQEVG